MVLNSISGNSYQCHMTCLGQSQCACKLQKAAAAGFANKPIRLMDPPEQQHHFIVDVVIRQDLLPKVANQFCWDGAQLKSSKPHFKKNTTDRMPS